MDYWFNSYGNLVYPNDDNAFIEIRRYKPTVKWGSNVNVGLVSRNRGALVIR